MKKQKTLLIYYLIFFIFTLQANAQKKVINGTVKTKSGEPLIGVSVLIKGTGEGTSTNADGNFSISVSPKEILEFSYIGYLTQTVPANENYQKIILEENSILLENIVVIGYGSVRKTDLTGAVSTIKADELKDGSGHSIESLLQGRAAGLQITNTSQDPGSNVSVRIRGGSSIKGSNTPLLVVDGFPIGDAGNLKQINPADITSVEVLKDASASSIYGSRGSNGVIMITTRKAKKGTTTVNIKQQLTFSQFSSEIMRWKNPVLMAELDNESKRNSGLAPLYIGAMNSTNTYYPSISEIQNGTWPYFTDWTKVVFRNLPITSTTSVSLNNGSEKTSYNLSASYMDQQGVYIKDKYSRGTVSLNIKHEFTNNFSISSISNISKDFRDTNSGLSYARNPLWPVYNEDGSYFLNGNNDFSHPVALTEHRKIKFDGTDFITSWIFDWQIYSDLNIKSHINYKFDESNFNRYDPDVYTSNGKNNKGAASMDNWKNNNYTIESYLTYNKKFLKCHTLNVMLGHSYEYILGTSTSMESYEFNNDTLGNENMASGNPELNRHSNDQTETKLLSYMGRINYSLKDKYLLTFTIRADGSSKFSENNKWAWFPSGAASWKMHQEEFIQQLKLFDELKLRASYGISGNQGISPYQTLSRYGIETFYNEGKWNTAIGPGYINGTTGVGGRYKKWGGIPNTNLKWETTSQLNLGIDMAFLDNRLRVTADYYNKYTKDLLRERYLPLSSGYDQMWVNDGEIRNRGVELTLEGNIVQAKDWDITGTFILSKNKNKIMSLGNAVSAGLSTDYITGTQYEYYGSGTDPFLETSPNILAVGQPVNVFYGYRVNGILQSDEEGIAAGLTGQEARAGEYKYVDLNEDGTFDTNDRTIIGDPNPDFTASINLKFRYKKFDLSVFMYGVFGNDILWGGMYSSTKYTPLRWTPDNPTNDYPSLRQSRLYYTSDWFIKDGSFLRIQNLNLGYNFNSLPVKALKNIRIYLNAENLYTFTRFEGYDPEVRLDGRYEGYYPKLRKYTVGVDITF